MNSEIKTLKKKAVQVRRDIAEMTAKSKGGAIHIGPALSSADIMTALYFSILTIDPENPDWDQRDRFILSKGHGYAGLYSVLAERGFFAREELLTIRTIGTRLQGHPVLRKAPGIDMTSGSLGNGLSCGLGLAKAMKLQGVTHRKVYVILGDGESQEGMVWEAAMAAPNLGLDNVVAIIDYNHYQSCGPVDSIMSLHPLDAKWKTFGWHVMEMNGHDMCDIVNKLTIAKEYAGKPVCIVAHTVKGKGIPLVEGNNKWHAGIFNEEQYAEAMQALDEQEKAIEAE